MKINETPNKDRYTGRYHWQISCFSLQHGSRNWTEDLTAKAECCRLAESAKACMVHTPPLEHDITICLSKDTWLPSSAPQRLAPVSKFIATLHQVDIWRRTWIHILLPPRYCPRHSIHILEELRLPFTSSMPWQPFSNADRYLRDHPRERFRLPNMFFSVPRLIQVGVDLSGYN